MLEENFLPLNPLAFFSVQMDCLYLDPHHPEDKIKRKEYQLPSFEKLTGELPFGEVNMGWNESGLYFFCQVFTPFQDVFYPDVTRGDSLELFIGTRDVKTGSLITKFCHHFFFLPQEIDERQKGEITRFRMEDAHELADPKELQLKSKIHKKGYELNIFIPSQCLHGYDPDQFTRLKTTYRLNRASGPSQHFSVLSNEFGLEQQPSLWSTINLVKTNGAIRKSSPS